MPKLYAVTIEDAENNPREVNLWRNIMKYEMLDLPDGIVLAVPPNATEDIKIAAQEAQNGNYNSLMHATGYSEGYDVSDEM
jgi:hypothetical protein